MHRLARILGATALLHAAAAPADEARINAGWVEKIRLAAAMDHPVKAKLDSGAKTSSINARKIEGFKRNGDDWVRFQLVLEGVDDEVRMVPMTLPVARHVRIKEHRADHDRRPIVELEFCFAGRLHHAEFSLVDRSKFHYPVLLGRRFLAGVATIDPGETFVTEDDCSSPDDAGEQP